MDLSKTRWNLFQKDLNRLPVKQPMQLMIFAESQTAGQRDCNAWGAP
jgi:hypothetical protein